MLNVACSRLLRRMLAAATVAAVLGALVAIASADNTDPNNSGARFAWGENIGWLSARPSGEAYGPGGSGVQVSDTDVTGYLWGENVGWVNLSCKNDNNCAGAAGNWGVKNDGAGNLTGYAWGENIGWVSFSCQNTPASCASTGNYGVKINNYTVTVPHATAGAFSGYAYGENIGWISFSCANNPSTCAATGNYQLQTGAPDTDGDGYTDAEEAALGKDPFVWCKIMRANVVRDANGRVNILDLSQVALYYNQTIPPAPALYDQNADGKINIIDLGSQASVYNQLVTSCP